MFRRNYKAISTETADTLLKKLPSDILFYICSFLDPEDIFIFAKLNQFLYQTLSRSNLLWAYEFKLHFPHIKPLQLNMPEFYKIYKQEMPFDERTKKSLLLAKKGDLEGLLLNGETTYSLKNCKDLKHRSAIEWLNIKKHQLALDYFYKNEKKLYEKGVITNFLGGYNLVHWAISLHQKIEDIHELIDKHQFNIDGRDFRYGNNIQYQFTLLHAAALVGYEEAAEDLIEKGANINPIFLWEPSLLQTSMIGITPLLYTVVRTNQSLAIKLLEKGANPNYRGACFYSPTIFSHTPLHAAIKNGDVEMVAQLIKYGADVHLPEFENAKPFLHCAAERGFENILKLLLDSKCRIDEQTLDGATALFLAVVNGHLDSVKMLLNENADHTIPLIRKNKRTKLPKKFKTKEGDTCLHAAARLGHAQIVAELLKKEASVLALNRSKETPAKRAAENVKYDLQLLQYISQRKIRLDQLKKENKSLAKIQHHEAKLNAAMALELLFFSHREPEILNPHQAVIEQSKNLTWIYEGLNRTRRAE